MGNRRRVLDAAIELVGLSGVRALTHARVDAAAELPKGSTSNYFRTRAALVAGVIEHLAARERADAGVPNISSADDLVAALTHMIAAQSTTFAARTRARYALFLEAEGDAVAPLQAQRQGFEAWTRDSLLALGGDDAARNTHFLMAACDGLLLHLVTVDPTIAIEPIVTLAVRSALGSADL